MRRSESRILTTHSGSLPRPPELVPMVLAEERGEQVDAGRRAAVVREAVREVVKRQVEAGVDVVSDGELGKPGFATYVKSRLTGFGGQGTLPKLADLDEFPAYADREVSRDALRAMQTPNCTGEIRFIGHEAVQRDIDNLKVAMANARCDDGFLTAASPGAISLFFSNQCYASHTDYLEALAEAMREEYEAIASSGLLLQVDCPDLAMGHSLALARGSADDPRVLVRRHVDALNHALANISPERVRMHVCWGNYEGPHHHDIELYEIIDTILDARPAAVSFMAANPRHEHEWRVWRDVALPPGKVLIPGVIDATNNFIEHPELVAERIDRFARLVGPENVIAGTDCGFATFVGLDAVDPEIAWAKLETLSRGARLASSHLYRQPRRALRAMSQRARRTGTRIQRLARREREPTPAE